jgi:hypothetical protein
VKWWLVLVVACGTDRAPIAEVPVDEPPATQEPIIDLEPGSAKPTYYRDVAPILTTRCAGCHVAGGVGPFPLTTYEDAAAMSEAIAAATTTRAMPPWAADASGACGTFVESRWLRRYEIETLANWHATGAPLGDPAEAIATEPPAPTPFTPATTLASQTAYVVRPGPDEYRCFPVDPALAQNQFITAFALQLDRADVVHHMQLFAADGTLGERTIDQRDAADPGPGYACDNEGVGPGLRYIGVWAGGDLVRRWPDDTGIEIKAGHRLVVQFHYHNHGSEPVADRSAVQLELATSVERAGRIASNQITGFQLAAGQATTLTQTSPLAVSAPAQIRGARIHMHGYGTSARMELVREGETRCVLDLPRWDVGWQLFYRFADPIDVVPGDQIKIRCTYDTTSSLGPVNYGVGTEDEMCIGYTFLTP